MHIVYIYIYCDSFQPLFHHEILGCHLIRQVTRSTRPRQSWLQLRWVGADNLSNRPKGATAVVRQGPPHSELDISIRFRIGSGAVAAAG